QSDLRDFAYLRRQLQQVSWLHDDNQIVRLRLIAANMTGGVLCQVDADIAGKVYGARIGRCAIAAIDPEGFGLHLITLTRHGLTQWAAADIAVADKNEFVDLRPIDCSIAGKLTELMLH